MNQHEGKWKSSTKYYTRDERCELTIPYDEKKTEIDNGSMGLVIYENDSFCLIP